MVHVFSYLSYFSFGSRKATLSWLVVHAALSVENGSVRASESHAQYSLAGACMICPSTLFIFTCSACHRELPLVKELRGTLASS